MMEKNNILSNSQDDFYDGEDEDEGFDDDNKNNVLSYKYKLFKNFLPS